MNKTLEVVFVDDPKEWCVDVDGTLAPMDDAELWDALDRGEVSREMRVWRSGLEGWTPVEDLPELVPWISPARILVDPR